MEHGPNLLKVLTFLDYTEGGEALWLHREVVQSRTARLGGLWALMVLWVSRLIAVELDQMTFEGPFQLKWFYDWFNIFDIEI